jgi:hypothetical protein
MHPVTRHAFALLAVAGALAAAVPAHADVIPVPTCEQEAATFIDVRGGTTGYGVACYSDSFRQYCGLYTELRYPNGGYDKTCDKIPPPV